ncbi:MAG: hypothetical protein ACOC3A_06010 [Thermodesulfobacteriota bacterium]
MSIQLVARELYRLIREVEALEKEIAAAPHADREELKDRLRRLKAERDRMRRMVDGGKEAPSYPARFR